MLTLGKFIFFNLFYNNIMIISIEKYIRIFILLAGLIFSINKIWLKINKRLKIKRFLSDISFIN